MKIGIITINDNNNYGNRLQNYALQQFLYNEIKIEEVNSIWYDLKYTSKTKVNIFSWKLWIKYLINWKNIREYLKIFYLKDNIRMYNIGKFTNKISTKFDFKIKDNLGVEYDYFIVGSDQVWNPNFGQKKIIMLI